MTDAPAEIRSPGTIAIAGATLDLGRRELRVGCRHVVLSPQLMAVAELLVRRAGRVVTHAALIGAVYPNPTDEPEGAEAVIRTRVWKFRRLFREFGVPIAVRSIHGAGYVLDVT